MRYIYKPLRLTFSASCSKRQIFKSLELRPIIRSIILILVSFCLINSVLRAQTFPAHMSQLPPGKKIIITYQAKINKPLTPRTTTSVADQMSVTADGLTPILSDNPATSAPNDATTTQVLGCTINSISAGMPTCGINNNFNIDITVKNDGGAPTTGNLVVEANGQTFTAPVKTDDTLQTILITLPANGQAVDVKAYYSDLPDCTLTKAALFVAPVGCGIVGNRVWEDLNGNGIQDDGTGGIPNVTVFLLRCNGDTLAQTLTDANGLYRFSNVAAGDYKLRFSLASAGSTFATAMFTLRGIGVDTLDSNVDPNTKETACFTLAAGQQNLSLDAGLYVPGSIGNQVWVDNNRNNIFDGGDGTLAGVTVRLYRCDSTNTLLASQTTGANGLYLFSNLMPGNYRVGFSFPSSSSGIYERVTPNIGNDNTDSDAGADGFTGCYVIQSRTQNLTVDAGYTYCPPATNLACIANVNLTMNATCALQITPGMLLTTTPSCASTFEVRVGPLTGAPFGDVVTSQYVGQPLRAVVIDKQTNNFCSSTIVVQDVTKPVLVCPPNTNKAIAPQQIQLINGTLSTLSNSVNTSTLNCFQSIVNSSSGNHYYDLYSFTVTKADVFTFELSAAFGDGAALLFDDEVNIQSLCQGVFAQSYQSFASGIFFTNLNPILRLTARLVPGKTYTLLTTSRAAGITGAYSWAAYSDGTGLISNVNALQTQGAYDLICTDINQILNKTQSLSFVGTPDVSDNCGTSTVNVTFSDQLIDGGDCAGSTIVRTFTAKDVSGNTSQCTQLISIRKPTLADVVYPPLTYYLECDAGFPMDANGNPSPTATGYPFVKTAFGNFDLSANYCSIAASYVDKPKAVGCSGTYTFLREWTISDYCHSLNYLVFSQLIQVGDRKVPVVQCPTADYDNDGVLDTLVFSTTSNDCFASFDVPAPTITDNCSSATFKAEIISDTLLVIRDEFGFIIDTRLEKFVRATVQSTASLRVNGIPLGNHTLRYTVTDACGNVTKIECPFKVADLVEPTVVCKSSITISLSGNGMATVYALDVNESSRDNCAIDSILIRRKYTRDPVNCDSIAPYWSDWATAVAINCCDIGTPVSVEVRVMDKAGNANECVANVEVLDKIKPFCVAPPAVSLPCTALPKVFNPYDTLTLQSLFGVAVATDNCGANWRELEPIVNLSDCNYGTITRRFSTFDRSGNTSINTCQQVVTITKVNNYEIKFPKDASIQCGLPFADTLQVNKLACDQISINVTEDRFSPTGNECYRIFRTYRVINWCEYDGVSQPIVIGRDEDCDNKAGDEDVWVLRRPNSTFIDRNNVETDNIPAAGQRGCTPVNPRGYWRTSNSIGFWQYTQVIQVYDSIPPDLIFASPTPFCATSDNCNGQVNVPFVVSEDCTPGDVTLQVLVDLNANGTSDGTLQSFGGALNGAYPNYEIVGTFVKGKHAFLITAIDNCGNSNTEKINFEVVDCKAPSFNCLGSVTINLQAVQPVRDVNGDGVEDRGMAVVKAKDFISTPVSDCSGPVRYSINKVGETPSINRDSLVLTCVDLSAPVPVEIYAWDNASNPYAVQPGGGIGGPNFSRCQANIVVKDDVLDACAPPKQGVVNGEIKTEDGDPVEGVFVSLSGKLAATTRTNAVGKYGFSQLDEGYDYSVTPLLDSNYINGVSTIDLIIITKHILGVQPLDSPYKLIAADVNNSHSITTLDIIQIRKLILGIDIAFSQNTSWRFVDASYRFPVQNNPWFEAFPEVYSINDLSGTLRSANFVAIKIGDVNLNAVTTSQALLENRETASPFEWRVKDQTIRSGATFSVTVEADIKQVQGYQATLAFDTEYLELTDVAYGVAQEENFGWRWVEQGFITTSWNESKQTPLASGKTNELFTLFFKAKKDGRLRELLHLNSRYTLAEAYDQAGRITPVALQFYQEAGAHPFELYQNVPNPFTSFTNIGFYLPEAAVTTLTIFDASGKRLRAQTQAFESGYHQIAIEKKTLPTGVLYYQLTADQHVAVKKMILIE